MRKAKIVCTIGPATSSAKAIESLIVRGMDVARLNFSHGDHDFHADIVKKIRNACGRVKKDVAILQDLQGIKIRVGDLKSGKVHLTKGRMLHIRSGSGMGDEGHVYIDYPWLVNDAKKGDVLLLDDGLIRLQITERKNDTLTAIVLEGGVLNQRKGVNLPHIKVRAPFFTDKDRSDLEFGLGMEIDYVALSFVRTAHDIMIVKKWLLKRKASVPIIAKIEREEGIRNIDHILEVSDGIMVARGDLGIEMPFEETPMLQKMLIEKANQKQRLVITATQMLESMTTHSRPTRAETTDVANAVLDATDALMLSEETATGSYPAEAASAMDSIIAFTENSTLKAPQQNGNRPVGPEYGEFSDAIARAASIAAKDVGAQWIVVFTRSGFTARLISKFRPKTPIIAFSPEQKVVRQMSMYWGVTAYCLKHFTDTDSLIRGVDGMLVKLGHAKAGARILIVASHPPSISGKTNFMKLHIVT
ncbi:MAG TPA: pyruvate kinase [Syntrophorhabdaceae bacterium]|nr:pyruvate kinase [Syntrophorhabdaceae bacterium]